MIARALRVRLLILTLLLALSSETYSAAPSATTQEPQAAGDSIPHDAVLEAQAKEIASQLRCPTCRALSIQDSPSDMARQMRGVIREKLREGMTPDQVDAYFVDRYGEWILLNPRAAGINWMVWLLPIFLIAGGLIFVLTTAFRWVKKGRDREAALLNEPDSIG